MEEKTKSKKRVFSIISRVFWISGLVLAVIGAIMAYAYETQDYFRTPFPQECEEGMTPECRIKMAEVEKNTSPLVKIFSESNVLVAIAGMVAFIGIIFAVIALIRKEKVKKKIRIGSCKNVVVEKKTSVDLCMSIVSFLFILVLFKCIGIGIFAGSVFVAP